MNYETVRFDIQNRVALVRLNRPERLNALNNTLIKEIVNILESTHNDRNVGVLVITGEGRGFCAGGDLKELRDRRRDPREPLLLNGIYAIPRAIRVYPKPIIAAVNGPAMGAGCDLCLMCDIRIASTAATFGMVYVNVGLVPDFGSYYLPRLVGVAKACELIFTGDKIGAKEAKEIGMVNHVVSPSELMAKTMELAKKIADGPSLAIEYAKKAIYKGLEVDLETALDYMSFSQGLLRETDDFLEGIAAFREKRKPRFKTYSKD